MRKILIVILPLLLASIIFLFWPINRYEKSFIYKATLLHQIKNNNWENVEKVFTFIEKNTHDEKYIVSFIELLGNYAGNTKWPVIINATKNKSPQVRASAVHSLAKYPSEEAKQAVFKCIKDKKQIVRIKAVYTTQQWSKQIFTKIELEKIEKAIVEYESFLFANSDDSELQYDLGNFYTKNKKFNKAIEAYNNSLNIDKNQINTIVNLGMAHMYLKDYSKAKEFLNHALELNPDNEIALTNYALLMIETKNLKEAESVYRKIFKLNPNSAQAAYNIAVLNGSDNYIEAEKWAGIASKLDPGSSNYQYSYAYYLMLKGEPRKAVFELIELIEKNAYYIDAYMLLAQLYHENNDSESAIKLLKRAKKIPNTSPQMKARISSLLNEVLIQ